MTQHITAVPLNTTRELSSVILDALASVDVTQGDSICACALTLGRLLAPHKLDQEDEIKVVQDVVDWIGLYWASREGMN